MKWTIVRKHYGFPDETYLYKEDDNFIFDTELEAVKCLNLIFERGEWIDDIRYGKVRYYVDTFNYNRYMNTQANIFANAMMGE